MRLTLRTLLAYLDDALDPAETKVIGQKIQESAVAGKLVSLIRLVVRQRRLKAPSVSGPNVGIDPNVVAQYLDSTLPPEQVVEVEKVLLTSDELLAEVASCHQVLALVAGKPADVSDASRERLYALGPVSQADQLRVEEPRPSGNHSAATPAREPERDATLSPAKSAATEVPEYLRQNTWSQRMFPAAIVTLLAVVCIGLLIADPGFLTGIREAKRELAKSDRDTGKPAVGDTTDGGTKPVEVADSNPAMVQTPDASAVPQSPSVPPGVDPTPLADVPEPPKKGVPAEAPADATAPSTPVPAVPAAPANTAIGKDPTPVLNPVAVQYLSNDGVVLRHDEQQHHWFMLPRRSTIAPGERLVVLEPFEAILDIDRGGMVANVMGDSVIRIMPPDRETATGLDIRRGRVLLRSNRKEAAQCPVISVMVGHDLWRLEFLSPETTCTFEVAPREPVQFEKSLGANWYIGILRVLTGGVKWTGVDGKSVKVAAETALEIVPPLSDQPVVPAPVSSSIVPDWTDPQRRRQGPMKQFAAKFEKQFDLDQPVEMTLLALLKDSNAKLVELAVHGLTMTDDYAGMVQALAECSYEEGRFAARDGLRGWLVQPGDRGPQLKGLLEQKYPPSEASAVYILLWGFRPEDASSRATSLELVTWLRSNHVEVRELAYFWIVHLTNRKWEFRASDVPARRESAVRKIESHIMSVGALSKPTDKEPAPKKPE